MKRKQHRWLDRRKSGVLLHLSSLPGEYGIGNLGSAARRFIDFLKSTGFSCWQICPAGPTGYGDSPYQSFSSYAGNPYFLDLNLLIRQGLIADSEVESLRRLDWEKVEYGELYHRFWPILEKAVDRFDPSLPIADYPVSWDQFLTQHEQWLDAYCLFMAVKKLHGGKPWWQWDTEYRNYDRLKQLNHSREVSAEQHRHRVYQYLFFNHWEILRTYAHENGIEIIGDVPIFVAHDSADVWSHQDVFYIHPDGKLKVSAGVPPDYFSETGQYWGNPLYDWQYLKQEGYQWWMNRLAGAFELYDVIRLDHFRAFSSYWEIPGGAPDATSGRWVEGPGEEFFDRVFEVFNEPKLIAEDLGYIDRKIYDLRETYGLPGMKILQFGFGHDTNNVNLPHFYPENSVVYCGTHDNETTIGWLDSLEGDMHRNVWEYFQIGDDHSAWPMIRTAFFSVSRLAVVTMQDLLGLGSEARMNTPGTAWGNWQWRFTDEQMEKFVESYRDCLLSMHRLSSRTGEASGQHLFSEAPKARLEVS